MADNFELFTTIDDTEIEKIVTENLEETLSETLHPGDERLMFANAFIALLCTVFAYLNDRAKMRLLRFAEAETLDYIGERVNCPRLGKEKATAIKEKCEELVQLAIAKGTPVLEKAANEVREKTIQATREVLVRLEEADRKAKAK